MSAVRYSLIALVLLAGCDGNPLTPTTPPPDTGGGGGGSTGIHDVALPPGTANPTAKSDIIRKEAPDTSASSATYGNGFVTDYTYNAADDTFHVDGLAFDGANVYQRGNPVGSINGYAVYQSDDTYADSVTGTPINQFTHRALYGVSTTGKTAFAIVRTGAYIPYGFGGFIYQRTGGVTLPTSGQAHFAGAYAGLRDFTGTTGLQYADGDMTVDIDFNDFNAGNGVKGYVSNRHIYDIDGNDITNQVLSQLNTNLQPGVAMTELPTLVFNVDPGAMDANGEISGTLGSTYTDSNGVAQPYETGQYYAVVAGDATTANSEVTGIIVVTDTGYISGATTRETGGFILYRQ
jgi:hypothetical protein